MNKPLLLLLFIVLLSATAFAVPVSYQISLTEPGNYTIEAVSYTGTTTIDVDGDNGLINHLGNPDERVEFFVDGEILRRIEQPLPGSVVALDIVTDGADLDKDGNPDGSYPTGTGLLGDENYISTNVPAVDLVNSSSKANFTSNGKVIIEFDYTTTNLSKVEIWTDDGTGRGNIVIKGLNHSGTKTAYIDRLDNTSSSICVKDAELTDISQISSLCTGTDEYALVCDGVSNNGYTCSIVDSGSRYKISGLTHSAVQEQPICGDGIIQAGEVCDGSNLNGASCTTMGFDGGTLSCTSTCQFSTSSCTNTGSPSGSSGGSGGRATFLGSLTCEPEWSCVEWGECQESGIQDCLEWVDANECGKTYDGGNFRDCNYVPEEEPEVTTEVIDTTLPEQANGAAEEQTQERARSNLFTGNVVREVVGDTLNFMRGNKAMIAGIIFVAATVTAVLLFTFTRGGRRNFRRIKRKMDKYYNDFE